MGKKNKPGILGKKTKKKTAKNGYADVKQQRGFAKPKDSRESAGEKDYDARGSWMERVTCHRCLADLGPLEKPYVDAIRMCERCQPKDDLED